MVQKSIGFIAINKGWGGLEMNMLNLAQWLSEKYRVVQFGRDDTRIYQEAMKRGVEILPVKPNNRHIDVFSAYRLARKLKKEDISVLFLFVNKDIAFVSLLKKLFYRKLKVIYLQQMHFNVRKDDWLHTFRYASINYWIAPLEYLKNQVLEKTRIPEQKLRVIPLSTDVRRFKEIRSSRRESLNILELDPRYPLIGILGRIDPTKGQLFLVKAVKKLIALNHPVELLIMGSPTISNDSSYQYFDEIKNYIADHQLGEYIHIHDFSENVTHFYNAIDWFAMASRKETFGMVTIEAMLSGVPVLGANAYGTAEILNHGELGALFEADDEDSFCEAYIELSSNKEKAEEMARKAQKVAIKKYDYREVCREIEQLIE